MTLEIEVLILLDVSPSLVPLAVFSSIVTPVTHVRVAHGHFAAEGVVGEADARRCLGLVEARCDIDEVVQGVVAVGCDVDFTFVYFYRALWTLI